MAIKNREVKESFIFLSVQGVQYANKAFANTLESNYVIRSRSRISNCFNNAVAESFFKFLKTELIYGNTLITKEEIKKEMLNILSYSTTKKGVTLTLTT